MDCCNEIRGSPGAEASRSAAGAVLRGCSTGAVVGELGASPGHSCDVQSQLRPGRLPRPLCPSLATETSACGHPVLDHWKVNTRHLPSPRPRTDLAGCEERGALTASLGVVCCAADADGEHGSQCLTRSLSSSSPSVTLP